jgi:D-alanine-D-alanine ligase
VRIGLTFNARSAVDATHAVAPDGVFDPGAADDTEEEFDSLQTIEALADVIRSFGHDVELLGDGEPLLRRLLEGPRPELIFNIAEGRGIGRSREARVPAVCELLGIPHTGSDPLTLAATLDKDCAKRLVRDAGVPTPRWVLVDRPAEALRGLLFDLPLPVILKPAYEGSSKGIRFKCFIDNQDELIDTADSLRTAYRQPVLAEEFIEGDELTVGMVGNPPSILGVMRILPTQTDRPFVYSLEVKRDWKDRVRYECPAQLKPEVTSAVERASRAVWQALGCRDVARIDFRLRNDVPYFLEANPLPGLSPSTSDLIFITDRVGISHRELIGRILDAAVRRIADNMADASPALAVSGNA